jgi:hypothetical protein
MLEKENIISLFDIFSTVLAPQDGQYGIAPWLTI